MLDPSVGEADSPITKRDQRSRSSLLASSKLQQPKILVSDSLTIGLYDTCLVNSWTYVTDRFTLADGYGDCSMKGIEKLNFSRHIRSRVALPGQRI